MAFVEVGRKLPNLEAYGLDFPCPACRAGNRALDAVTPVFESQWLLSEGQRERFQVPQVSLVGKAAEKGISDLLHCEGAAVCPAFYFSSLGAPSVHSLITYPLREVPDILLRKSLLRFIHACTLSCFS